MRAEGWVFLFGFAKANSTSLHFENIGSIKDIATRYFNHDKTGFFASTFCFDIVYISTFRDEHIMTVLSVSGDSMNRVKMHNGKL